MFAKEDTEATKLFIEILLFNIKHKSLQIFTLWMIDVDGMVCRLMNLVQDANLTVGLDSSSKDSSTEVLLRHNLRAAERKENTTRLDALQALDIKACVTLKSITQGSTMLGESWRIENDEVVHLVVGIQILESILAESGMTLVAWEVESYILIGKFDSLGAAVYRMDKLCAATHCVNGEATGVAEHIENRTSSRIGLKQTAVLTLIDEEASLLSLQPVDMETESVLHSHVTTRRAVYESIVMISYSIRSRLLHR